MRRACRKDSNHTEVIDLYRELGCSVHDTSMVGFGYPDISLGLVGVTSLVEIKVGDADYTAAQKVFHRDWRGEKPVTIRSIEEVIAHVIRVRKRISVN